MEKCQRVIEESTKLLISVGAVSGGFPDQRGREHEKGLQLNVDLLHNHRGTVQAFMTSIDSGQKNLLDALYDYADHASDDLDDTEWGKGLFGRLRKRRKAEENKRRGTRLLFEEEPEMMFEILLHLGVASEATEKIRKEWGDDIGVSLFFNSDFDIRVRGSRNKGVHADEDAYPAEHKLHIFATNDQEMEAEELIKELTFAYFQCVFITAVLKSAVEERGKREWSEGWDEVCGLDDAFRTKVVYSGHLIRSKSDDLRKFLEAMFWGPEYFILNDEDLDEAYGQISHHRVVLFTGFGAVGKTALANKIMWDNETGQGPEDFEEFEWCRMWTSKIGSDQGTLVPGKEMLQRTTNRHNVGIQLGVIGEDTSMGRLNGSARQIWTEIVEMFGHEPKLRNDDELRKLSLDILTEKRILVVIDNFEDFQNPLVHTDLDEEDKPPLKDEMREVVLHEYTQIVGWIDDLLSRGDQVRSRVIVTKRGGQWDNAALASSIPALNGKRYRINELSESDALTLFHVAMQDRIKKLDSWWREDFDANQWCETKEDAMLKLETSLAAMTERKVRTGIEETLRAEWGGKANPQIILFAVASLHRYRGEGIECINNMLEDWAGPNKQKKKIYFYGVQKILGPIMGREPQLNFLKGVLSNPEWVNRGFSIEQLEHADKLLSNDAEKTRAFLSRLRDEYWIKNIDTDSGTIHKLNDEIAKSVINDLGIVPAEIESEHGGEDTAPTEISMSDNVPLSKTEMEILEAREGLLERWEEWLDECDDFTKTDLEPKLPWRSGVDKLRGNEPILNLISREQKNRKSLRYFGTKDGRRLPIDEQINDYKKRLFQCCRETIVRMHVAASSSSGIGLWDEFKSALSDKKIAQSGRVFEKGNMIPQALSGLTAIWHKLMDEISRDAHRACRNFEKEGLHSAHCQSTREKIHAHRKWFMLKFEEITDQERLEETTGSDEINEAQINALFGMADGVAQLRQRGRV